MIKKTKKQTDIIYENAGRKINQLRQEQGYSRKKLAELAGITEKFLYEIESGRKGFSAANLYYISRILQVDADYILGLSNQTEESEYTKFE